MNTQRTFTQLLTCAVAVLLGYGLSRLVSGDRESAPLDTQSDIIASLENEDTNDPSSLGAALHMIVASPEPKLAPLPISVLPEDEFRKLRESQTTTLQDLNEIEAIFHLDAQRAALRLKETLLDSSPHDIDSHLKILEMALNLDISAHEEIESFSQTARELLLPDPRDTDTPIDNRLLKRASLTLQVLFNTQSDPKARAELKQEMLQNYKHPVIRDEIQTLVPDP